MNNLPRKGTKFEEKYEIQEILGTGGIGTVCKALQLDCGRVVALKVLLKDDLDDDTRTRFLREAQALSKLSHPNIVAVYNLGVGSGGLPYLVMEFVKGQSLRGLINSLNRVSVLKSLRIIRDAARAMNYVHDNGIVHRDLKPENILIAQVPDPDTVKIVDFGLVRLVNPNVKEQKLTSTGDLLGTSSYMSPEQCKGQAVDFRTDIYSLTVCLFELMIGKRPFDADSPMGLIYKHVNEETPKILSSQVDHFHPILNEIISRGMAKDPKDRYASMQDMANQIDESISLLGSSEKTSPRKHSRVLALSLLLLCAFLVLGAVLLKNNATQDRERIGISKAMSLAHRESDEKSEQQGRHSLSRYEKQYGSDSTEILKHLENLAALYRKHNKWLEAEELYKRSITIRETKLGPEHLTLVDPLNSLSLCYEKEGKTQEALLACQRLSEVMSSNNDLVSADALCSRMAALYDKLGNFAKEESLIESSLSFNEKRLGVAALLVSHTRRLLASCYLRQDKFEQAEHLLQSSIEIRTRLPESNKHDAAEDQALLADCYCRQKKYAEAEKMLSSFITIKEKDPKANETDELEHSLYYLAECYRQQHKYAQAVPLLKRSLVLMDKKAKPNLIDYEGCHILLSHGLIQLGYYSEAETIVMHWLNFAQKEKLSDKQLVGGIIVLVDSLLKQDRNSEAELQINRLLSICSADKKATNADLETALELAGNCQLRQKKLFQAKPFFVRLNALVERDLQPNQMQRARIFKHLADCDFLEKKYLDAEQLLNKSLAIFEQEKKRAKIEDNNVKADIYYQLGECSFKQLKYRQAEPFYELYLAQKRDELCFSKLTTMNALKTLAHCYAADGKVAQASKCQRQLESMRSEK